MNPIQLAIITIVVSLIIILIGYFWYQEIKFKQLVENNFNHKTEDVINESQSLILDGVDGNRITTTNSSQILEKDIFSRAEVKTLPPKVTNIEHALDDEHTVNASKEVFEDDFPNDSLEAVFARIHQIPFPYKGEIDVMLDYVIEIAFEDLITIRLLPEIAQYTPKYFRVYMLERDNNWKLYERGNKYSVKALKYVIHMVDKSGIISQAQISNIYNELFKFALQKNGHIQQSNCATSISKIQQQVKHLPELKLDLELYLVLKTTVDYISLANFFVTNGFTEAGGKFEYINNNVMQCIISDEDGNGLQKSISYSLLKLTSNLHFIPNPQQVIEQILDIVERFTGRFEARLLTRNKELFTEREYNSLSRYITNYTNNAKKSGIELGGELIRRLL